MSQLIRTGSNGALVRDLQSVINLVQRPAPTLTVDGIFGPKTYAAVITFQGRSALKADGLVGPLTSRALVGAVLSMALPQLRTQPR
ncbi:hypothetical protein G3480_22735 [Thiorhodococcus mannitoliphagus]|uniref:Peptidoglycan binding-like domain-containing protein n=1 Tax=Thiorhodococcus mannitoliphagus TaxID=329406 RepID=A0A6P1DZG4_9GAMM|nr:peptidoglycan-binding domain-containing protein [Thiorhodococcus mannitoliphagus]NEX23079.1 hypothetical protein [Thiorhodococcus mannitoliphagus]